MEDKPEYVDRIAKKSKSRTRGMRSLKVSRKSKTIWKRIERDGKHHLRSDSYPT
jgi:hypothetical protein